MESTETGGEGMPCLKEENEEGRGREEGGGEGTSNI